ncbi:hypothetical protein [Paraflavitalea speifideaquila]|uniref:hypothetical protein n=1 Tax=Paraflavitalea speifideaquila TaxID=3076558 RepID=UPI0028EBDEFA|nr:hypothetical protein [Paraflavitalea speifideiaquila]
MVSCAGSRLPFIKGCSRYCHGVCLVVYQSDRHRFFYDRNFRPSKDLTFYCDTIRQGAPGCDRGLFVTAILSYLISGNKTEKAKVSLNSAELIQRFKDVNALPEEEQGILIKIISAYVRDYKAKQAYAS